MFFHPFILCSSIIPFSFPSCVLPLYLFPFHLHSGIFFFPHILSLFSFHPFQICISFLFYQLPFINPSRLPVFIISCVLSSFPHPSCFSFPSSCVLCVLIIPLFVCSSYLFLYFSFMCSSSLPFFILCTLFPFSSRIRLTTLSLFLPFFLVLSLFPFFLSISLQFLFLFLSFSFLLELTLSIFSIIFSSFPSLLGSFVFFRL